MQPDDIIQQKEWHELSSEEKKILQGLVADEQEYNLIKKMMMIAHESAVDVPQINPSVQQHLHRAVKPATKKWHYAAAAAILLLAAAAWFFLKDEKEHVSPIAKDQPANKEIIKKDTVLPPKTEITQKPAPKKTKTPVIQQSNQDIQPSYASISTLIKDDSTLMAFITEVY
jgi:hypothetical protein